MLAASPILASKFHRPFVLHACSCAPPHAHPGWATGPGCDAPTSQPALSASNPSAPNPTATGPAPSSHNVQPRTAAHLPQPPQSPPPPRLPPGLAPPAVALPGERGQAPLPALPPAQPPPDAALQQRRWVRGRRLQGARWTWHSLQWQGRRGEKAGVQWRQDELWCFAGLECRYCAAWRVCQSRCPRAAVSAGARTSWRRRLTKARDRASAGTKLQGQKCRPDGYSIKQPFGANAAELEHKLSFIRLLPMVMCF